MAAPRAGLLQPTSTKAQINPGLSLLLDEKRGSRHFREYWIEAVHHSRWPSQPWKTADLTLRLRAGASV